MSSSVSWHVLYKIANAPINPFPFPHIYVRDVFPPDFYRELRAHLPPVESLKSLRTLGRVTPDYPESRQVLPLSVDAVQTLDEPFRSFWDHLASWLLGGQFGQILLPRFAEYLEARFGDLRQVRFRDEALIVQDYSTYSLGPHSDSPYKVAAFLFYLPQDDSLSHLGTSLYVPKSPDFRSTSGVHYKFADFERVATMPFLPNSLFAFLKTDTSFHGVEPIAEPNIRRDLLLYDIKVHNPPEQARDQKDAQPAAANKPVASFSF
jgi:hypothetical protein